jgi:hypothetical protein
MAWEPGDNFVISFNDKTCEERTETGFRIFLEKISEVAQNFGLTKSVWGDHDSMLLAMQDQGFLKRGKLIDEIISLDPHVIGSDRNVLEMVNYETLLDLNKCLKDARSDVFFGSITITKANEWTLARFISLSDGEKEFIHSRLESVKAGNETKENQKLLFLHYFTICETGDIDYQVESFLQNGSFTMPHNESTGEERYTTRYIKEYIIKKQKSP